MSDLPQRIEPGHEDYTRMMHIINNEGGKRLVWKGFEWMMIEDNAVLVFVKVGASNGFDVRYGDSSFG